MAEQQAELELIELDEQSTAVIRGEVATAELPDFFDRAFSRLNDVIAAQGVAIIGPAFALYHAQSAATADLEVGYPTASGVDPDGDVVASELPGGRVARLVHAGGFDGLGRSWARLGSWMADEGLTPGESFWEVYLTEPSPDMDPAELRTELNWPVVG